MESRKRETTSARKRREASQINFVKSSVDRAFRHVSHLPSHGQAKLSSLGFPRRFGVSQGLLKWMLADRPWEGRMMIARDDQQAKSLREQAWKLTGRDYPIFSRVELRDKLRGVSLRGYRVVMDGDLPFYQEFYLDDSAMLLKVYQ